MNEPLRTVLRQIDDSKRELRAYAPETMDWRARAKGNAKRLVPWLVREAVGLKEYVQDVANSPARVRDAWDELKTLRKMPEELRSTLDKELRSEKVLLGYLTGDIMSMLVVKYLIETHPDQTLASNGRSDYPDLFFRSYDYSMLPQFTRRMTTYGAALKSKDKRPVRVPDGLEIKTCRDRIAVDCHHPHAGLHLVLLFHKNAEQPTIVKDVLIAFLRKRDYREARRRTTATTVKYSFNGDRFVSLFPSD